MNPSRGRVPGCMALSRVREPPSYGSTPSLAGSMYPSTRPLAGLVYPPWGRGGYMNPGRGRVPGTR